MVNEMRCVEYNGDVGEDAAICSSAPSRLSLAGESESVSSDYCKIDGGRSGHSKLSRILCEGVGHRCRYSRRGSNGCNRSVLLRDRGTNRRLHEPRCY
jgi:hypothetical protein